jgi:hypothetical protein
LHPILSARFLHRFFSDSIDAFATIARLFTSPIPSFSPDRKIVSSGGGIKRRCHESRRAARGRRVFFFLSS